MPALTSPLQTCSGVGLQDDRGKLANVGPTELLTAPQGFQGGNLGQLQRRQRHAFAKLSELLVILTARREVMLPWRGVRGGSRCGARP